MKFVLLVASLVSALVSAALGFDIISVNNTAADLNHLIAGWAAWCV